MNDKQKELAEVIDEFATYLKLDGQANRAKGYERAAHNIRSASFLPPNPADIDGVGDSIRTTIAKYQRSGEIGELEELKEEYPWFDALKDVKHLGPARAEKVYQKFNVETIDDLLLVGDDLTIISGIGAKTANKIIESGRNQQ